MNFTKFGNVLVPQLNDLLQVLKIKHKRTGRKKKRKFQGVIWKPPVVFNPGACSDREGRSTPSRAQLRPARAQPREDKVASSPLSPLALFPLSLSLDFLLQKANPSHGRAVLELRRRLAGVLRSH